jgi:hypothetical protein
MRRDFDVSASRVKDNAQAPRSRQPPGQFLAPILLKSLARVPNLPSAQNKKYLCAIGSLSAGSHTSKTPSAVTA